VNFTMNDVFTEVVTHIPGVLASSDACTAIRAVNARLPAALFSSAGFECHLGVKESRADWHLWIESNGNGRDVLAGNIPVADLDPSLFDSPSWQRIRFFSKQWADPSSPLHENVRHVVLEFDQDRMNERAPIPGVFLAINKGSGQDIRAWLADALALLQETPLRRAVRDRLRYCCDALPRGAGVDYAASMLARTCDGVRIVILLDGGDLEDYLKAVGYPGSIDEIMEATAEFGAFARLRYLIDISDAVLPQIGIECFPRKEDGEIKTACERLLEHLAKRSLCLPEKRDALLLWPGYARTVLPSDLWPSYIFRRISHVKVVCRNRAPHEAKGYLSFQRKFAPEIIRDLRAVGMADETAAPSR